LWYFCNFLITYSHTSVPNLVNNSQHVYHYLLLQAMGLFRADGYHNKSLSEDTPNLVTMGLADLYHLSYPLCTILGISELLYLMSYIMCNSMSIHPECRTSPLGLYTCKNEKFSNCSLINLPGVGLHTLRNFIKNWLWLEEMFSDSGSAVK
jgi:hypothetical protein